MGRTCTAYAKRESTENKRAQELCPKKSEVKTENQVSGDCGE